MIQAEAVQAQKAEFYRTVVSLSDLPRKYIDLASKT